MAKKNNGTYSLDDIDDYSGNNMLGIRVSPTTVIGELGPKGMTLVCREIIDNNVDECDVMNVSIPIRIWIHSYKGGYEVRITDAGRGMPPDGIELLCTKLYTSGKQSGHSYGGGTAGTYGVGLVAAAATAKIFCCISKRSSEYGKLVVNEGNVVIDEYNPNIGFSQSGTLIFMQSDNKIFEDCGDFIGGEGEERLMEYIQFISAVSPKHVQLEVYKTNGRRTILEKFQGDINDTLKQFDIPTTAKLVFKTNPEDTMKEYVQSYYGIKPEDTVFDITEIEKPMDVKSGMEFNISFVVAKNMRSPHRVMSAVNRVFMRLQTSDHITVFNDVVKEIIHPFIDDVEVGSFFKAHYKLPIYPSILVTLKTVKFVGASKEGFKDNKFKDPYRRALLHYFGNYPEKWEELYEVIEDDINTKYKNFSKTIIRHKGLNNIFEHLNKPDNYKGCRSKDNRLTELFLTEGNSAGDALKSARDSTTQALYYLMGKTVNAFQKKDYDKDLIYQDLKQLIGVESHDTNLDNMSFSKIFILADADADGLHIATLLITIFYKINPLIISSGRVAICNPPLYSFSVGNKTLFMKDENARRDTLIETAYFPALDISIKTGGTIVKLEGDSYRDMCYMVNNVGTRIENAAKIVTIDPSIMELFAPVVEMLNPKHIDIEGLKKYFKLPLIYNKQDKALIIDMEDGSEITIPLQHIYKQLKEEVCPILDEVNAKYFDIVISTKLTGLYENITVTFVYLLGLFRTLDKQAKVSRFKGIGVLNPEQIGYTCVAPATRSMINIYSVGDIEKIMDYLGVDPTVRKSIIESVPSTM